MIDLVFVSFFYVLIYLHGSDDVSDYGDSLEGLSVCARSPLVFKE
jgi:hypothetical protein